MRCILGGLLFFLVLCASLFSWIVIEPRSIASLNPYIEKSLNEALPNYHFHITNNTIQWNAEQYTMDVRMKEVSVEDSNNEPVATFPEIKIDLTLSQLLIGKIKPAEMAILNPAFKIALGKGEALQVDKEEIYQKILQKILPLAKLKPRQATLKHIRIQNADILFSLPQKDILVRIKDSYTSFSHKNKILHINSRADTVIEEHPVFFEAELAFPEKDSVNLDVTFRKLPSILLKDIFPDKAAVENIDLTLNGGASVTMRANALPVIERFSLDNVTGSFSYPVYFTETIIINNLSLMGNVSPDFSTLTLSSFDADFANNAKLHASGYVKQKDRQIQQILLEANAANVPMDDVKFYWPSGVKGEEEREWVTERISKGIVPQAYAKLRISEEDIRQHHLSPSSLEAKVDFEGGEVHYMDDHPLATSVNGTAYFTGKHMDINITQGKILDSDIQKANVNIPDFMQHPAILHVTGEAKGPLQNLNHYFNAEEAGKVLTTDLQKLSGNATTAINLAIPLIHPLTLDDITVDITADAENAALPKLFGKYDITNSAVKFHFDGHNIAMEGKSNVNGIPLDWTSTAQLPEEEQTMPDGKYTIKGTLTDNAQKALYLPDIKGLTGRIPFDLTILDAAGKRSYQLNATLDQTLLKLENLGWEKKAGEKLALHLEADTQGNVLNLSKIATTSPTLTLSGTGQIQTNSSAITKLDLKTLRWGKNDISISFSETKSAHQWNIKGKSIDLSHARFGKLFTSSEDDKQHKSLQASVNIGQLIMKNKEAFKNVTGQIACKEGLCQTGRLSASTNHNGNLSIQLKSLPEKNKSSLHLESNRAGVIANALDIFSNMQGGQLSLEATFNKAPDKKDTTITGIVKIDNFRAVKVPILAKIATLASFEGITSILENKGVKFKRLRAPFTFENNTIRLKDTKAYGESLGVTAEGKIYTDNEILDLKGTFVPSYTVNNILGKLPLIGKLGDVLMGGEGQGILAVRYSIKGPYDKADVTVNPLSILTPGFLRNLFDIVDIMAPESHTESEFATIDPGDIAPAAGTEE